MIAGFSEKLYAAAVSWLYSSKRTAILLLTPCCCIVMPNSMWAMLIVRLECAMTMDWQSVSKSRRSGLKRSRRAHTNSGRPDRPVHPAAVGAAQVGAVLHVGPLDGVRATGEGVASLGSVSGQR